MEAACLLHGLQGRPRNSIGVVKIFILRVLTLDPPNVNIPLSVKTFGHFATSGHILLKLSFIISHCVNDIIGLKDPEREGRLLKQLLHEMIEMPIFGCESSLNKS